MTDRRLEVWDLPVRLFHWAIVILIALSWYSVEQAEMELHMWSGIAILALTLTRVVWGFIGSSSARFTSFIKGPRAIYGYLSGLLRRDPEKVAGHNPVGAWMILAFLLLLLAMPMTGLFANDDIFFEGPLAWSVTDDQSDDLTRIHKLLFDYLLIFIVIHIAAVLLYRLVLKEDLITPMVTGRRPWPHPNLPQLRTTHPLWALAVLLAAAGLIYVFILT